MLNKIKKIAFSMIFILIFLMMIVGANIKDVQITNYGIQIIFLDNTGYFIEK
jgi:hypothetical protein